MIVKQHSEVFITQLYLDHNSSLVRFLTRMLSDAGEAEDVAQSSYQKMLGVADPQAMENPKSYLFQVAANLAVDRIRKQQRRDNYLKTLKIEVDQDCESASNSPENKLAAQEQLDSVTSALDELPVKCRQVFLLQRGQHMTYEGIAEELGMSVSMVEKHISNALKHLRKRVNNR